MLLPTVLPAVNEIRADLDPRTYVNIEIGGRGGVDLLIMEEKHMLEVCISFLTMGVFWHWSPKKHQPSEFVFRRTRTRRQGIQVALAISLVRF